jgi:AmmeMemoRadiSam system protein B
VPTELRGTTTRRPAVAGVFYAAGRDRLQTQVLNLLAGVTSAPKATPKALIAPHAGYVYSGHVAAAAFATLQDNGHAVTRVVLIGPAHYVPVRGIAAPKHDAFETPLGRVPVDLEALSKIDDFQFVTRTNAPHAPEHALESSCHSFKRFCHRSKWFRWLSAMWLHRTLHLCWRDFGAGQRP